MTDRERIAELFKIARQEGELRKYADGLADAGELLEILKELGYTRQPKPPVDRVEALKKILNEIATKAVLFCPDIPNENYYAKQILSLFPEPVLTRISDEELAVINRAWYGNKSANLGILQETVQAQLDHAKKELGIIWQSLTYGFQKTIKEAK